MAVGQLPQGAVGTFRVAFQLVGSHSGQRKLLALALHLLQAGYGVEHVVVVFLLLVELHEDVEHVAAVAVEGIELLVGLDGPGVIARADIVLGHLFLIHVVVGTEPGGPLQTGQSQRILMEPGQIGGLQVVGFGRMGVDTQTMVQQIEGGGVVPGILLAHGFQEKVLVAQPVCGAQRSHGRGCRRSGFLLPGLAHDGCGQGQQQG